jgi:hypothetical protein
LSAGRDCLAASERFCLQGAAVLQQVKDFVCRARLSCNK